MALVPEYKIILLGEPGVGKTSCFYRIRDDVFIGSSSVSTVGTGVESLVQSVDVDGQEVKAILYDTAGGERFRTLTSNYYLNSDAAILMYSVEDRYSLERLQDEIENAMQFVDPDGFMWALCGNKCDLPAEVHLSTIQAKREQLETEVCFFTSAKTGKNVMELLHTLVKEIHRQRAGVPRRSSRGNSVHVAGPETVVNTTATQKKCCS